MNINDLSPELLQKAEACKTPEELFALANEEGIELSDEEIAEIAGGAKIRLQGDKRERRSWNNDEDSD